jgi:4-amino-4-deoxy-L-arabinose transferase-like glycosyltransferase
MKSPEGRALPMVKAEDRFEVQERTRAKLFVIVLVALVLRLMVVALVYQDQLAPRHDHWPFGYETGRIARSIASGEGFSSPLFEKTGPTAWMTPVYPYLVAGVFKLFGIYSKSSALILLSLNSLFSALTCVPVFLMARESFGQRTAVWASWAWALFPYAIYLSADWIWETCLTTFLLSWLFFFSLRLERSTRTMAWAGCGLLWGVAALSDPVVLSVLPPLLGWACYRSHRRGQRFGWHATALLLALVMVVTPWFVRNYRTFHQFIPFRDAFWLVMHVGNNGDTSHWAPDAAHPSTSATEELQYNRLGELNYMQEKKREAIQFIANHPCSFAWVTIRRFVFTWTGFWSFSREYLEMEPFDPPNIVLCATLTLLALAGLRRAFQGGIYVAVPYALVLIAFPMVYYISIPQIPYRHRIDPEVAVLASYGLSCWVADWRKEHSAVGVEK